MLFVMVVLMLGVMFECVSGVVVFGYRCLVVFIVCWFVLFW